MSIKIRETDLDRPLWLPPVISLVVLFVLFLTAMLVRRTAIADEARPVMIALSAGAAVAISLWGVRLVAQLRQRGPASLLAGGIMLFLGIYTAIHVLR